MLRLLKTNRSLRNRIMLFRKGIESGNVVRPTAVSKFVFLCGANKNQGEISERRSALIDFARAHLPHAKVFLAEKVFSLLQDEGHKGNILDIEHKISEFADVVLIVLESESAFAELGAFSHASLRKKLVVINDKRFEKAGSFINLGPIKAIEEASGANHIIHYSMAADGVKKRDAIGDVFSPLYDLLKAPLSSKQRIMTASSFNPAVIFNKDSVMFVHDLLYFTGPIKHSEMIEILIQIFDQADFKLREHLGLLSAFGAVNRNEDGIYRSSLKHCFFRYLFDVNRMIASFRNITQRYCPERIYGTG